MKINNTVFASLKGWTEAQLSLIPDAQPVLEPLSLTSIGGDAGFRHYFRLNTPRALLAVYAPPATEDSRAFCRIASVLSQHGIRAPQVFGCDFDQGFMLLQDLGSELLSEHITPESVDAIVHDACRVLLRLQQCPQDSAVFPRYDSKKLRQEMALFVDWFIGRELALELRADEQSLVNDAFSLLVQNAQEQPQVVVHRDYHSKNLIYAENGDYGVIDFQDAVIGPVTYDLVSIVKDRYYEWDDEQVARWVPDYANLATKNGILPKVNHGQFMRWFDLMGLQRHIKVLGIFSRLALRDKKPGYLALLPTTVSYTRRVLAKYPDFKHFQAWFEARLMPVINQQAWMQGK